LRPAGEITRALLDAARELRTQDQAPTLAELAAHAQVGYQAANNTVKNLKRRGRLRIVRTRRVGYVNKPVSEYEPVEALGAKVTNLTDRLTSLLMPTEKPSDSSPKSQPTGTGPSTSSTPALTPTTK
jgi:DNA-binding transcriptional regulator YhcF (GntR family)